MKLTKRINSRNKGATAEREVAALLTEKGFPASRGQQFAGSPDSPDVKCEALKDFHIEVKRTQKTAIYDWLDQALRDKREDQKPVIFHRKNQKDWIVILRLDDFLGLVK
jgi:Holliday junction resolvase